jgi:hypothetical protein
MNCQAFLFRKPYGRSRLQCLREDGHDGQHIASNHAKTIRGGRTFLWWSPCTECGAPSEGIKSVTGAKCPAHAPVFA